MVSGKNEEQKVQTIIDNRGDNTLVAGLQRMGTGGRELCIATAIEWSNGNVS